MSQKANNEFYVYASIRPKNDLYMYASITPNREKMGRITFLYDYRGKYLLVGSPEISLEFDKTRIKQVKAAIDFLYEELVTNQDDYCFKLFPPVETAPEDKIS